MTLLFRVFLHITGLSMEVVTLLSQIEATPFWSMPNSDQVHRQRVLRPALHRPHATRDRFCVHRCARTTGELVIKRYPLNQDRTRESGPVRVGLCGQTCWPSGSRPRAGTVPSSPTVRVPRSGKQDEGREFLVLWVFPPSQFLRAFVLALPDWRYRQSSWYHSCRAS